jgi:hypothetical protein
MFLVNVYHWLPMAANMLPNMERNIRSNYPETVTSFRYPVKLTHSRNAIARELIYTIPLAHEGTSVPLAGKINGRGFAQHTISYEHLCTLYPNADFDDPILALEQQVTNVLLNVLELRVLNKFAVLHEGILPITEFRQTDLKVDLELSAQRFLRNYHLTALIVDKSSKSSLPSAGARFMQLGLDFPDNYSSKKVVFSERKDTNSLRILFYDEDGFLNCTKSDAMEMDSCLYYYCALLIYKVFISIATNVAINIQNDLIPVRRGYVRDIKILDDDAFHHLAEKHTYMAYVTNKIKIMQKIETHLKGTWKSEAFQEKVHYFEQTDLSKNIFSAIDNDHPNSPTDVLNVISDDVERFPGLISETDEEARTLSAELSSFLEAEQGRQGTRLLDWQVEASRSNLEFARGGKNRANALKFLSIVTFASFGLALFDPSSVPTRLLIAVITIFLAFAFTDLYSKMYNARYQLTIPINKYSNPRRIAEIIERKRTVSLDGEGDSRTRVWNEKIDALDVGERNRIAAILFRSRNQFTILTRNFLEMNGLTLRRSSFISSLFYQPFTVTLKYTKSGYVRSITVSTEHWHTSFNSREVVCTTAALLSDALCLTETPGSRNYPGSFVAELLSKLHIPIDEKYPALNFLLALDTETFRTRLQRDHVDRELPELDREFLRILLEKQEDVEAYIKQLDNIMNDSRLLNKYCVKQRWLNSKRELLEEYLNTFHQGERES